MESSLDNLEKYTQKKLKLSVTKQRECINQVWQGLRRMGKEDVKKVQDRVVFVLLSQQVTECGGKLMMKLIVKCINFIFENGDYNRVTSTFITPICISIQASSSNNQISLEERLAKIYIVSKVFQTIKQSCFLGSPPSKELIDLFVKIGSKSGESQVRVHCYRALTRVLKSGATNLALAVPELVKNYAKVLDKLISHSSSTISEADTLIKVQCVKGLTAMIALTFSSSMLAQYFEQIQSLCFKGFAEDGQGTDASRSAFQNLLVEVYCLRLDEAQRHGDLTMSYKSHADSVNQGQEKSRKRNTTQMLEAPRTLGEIASFLAAHMYKSHQNQAAVESLTKTLSKIVIRSHLHFQACELDHLLNSVLLSLQTQHSKETKDAQQKQLHSAILNPAFELFKEIVMVMTDEQRRAFVECLTSTLDKRQLIMNKDTVEQFTPQFNSAKDQLRVSSMLNSHDQTELCLKTYAFLIEVISEGEISQLFQNEASMVQPVMRYLQDQPKVSTQVEAMKVIFAITRKVSNLLWIQNLLYQFLQLTTIENADLQTFSLGGRASLDELEQKQQNLNTLAECMSSLLKEVTCKSRERAVPLALAESTLKVVKGLVLGNFVKSDAQEKELGILCYPLKLNEVLESEELGLSRREAGWILVLGLLAQGECWMRQNIETFLMMFYSLFNKDMCGSQGFAKVSQILREFDLKIRALSALHYLVKTYRGTLLEENKNHLKLVSSLLCNCLQFLFTNSKEKEAKELVQIFQKASPRQYKEAKLQLLECIHLINHPNYFQSKMILILHLVCEQIVSSKKLTDQEGSLFTGVVDSVDFNVSQCSRRQPVSINDQLVKMAIQLFSTLFLTKSSLTSKNKLQLIKHLESHSIVDEAKQEVVHPSRLMKIAITCLSLVRGNVQDDSQRNYVLQPLEDAINQKIKQTTSHLMKYQGSCPGLGQVLAELTLFSHLDEIRSTPSLVSQLLRGSQGQEKLMMDIATKSFFIAQIFKVLDYGSLLRDNLDVDADIVQLFKQALAGKQVTQSQIAAIAYAIASIFKQSSTEQVPATLFQNLLPLALHCLQAGQMVDKSDKRSLHWFGKLASVLIKDKHQLATSSKIDMIDGQELSLSSLKQDSVLFEAFLDIQKAKAFRNQPTQIESVEDLEKLISTFKHHTTTLKEKVSTTQLLALLILQGSFSKIVESAKGATESPSQVLLNLLNHELRSWASEESEELHEDGESLQFNIKNDKVLALLKDSNTAPTHLDLINSLKSCCSLALKVELCSRGTTEAQFKHVIENLKAMLQFKYIDEYQHFQENPTSAHSTLKQAFDQDLHEQTLFEYSNFFFTLLQELPNESDNFFKQHLYNLITLSFKMTQRDQVRFKKLGVRMLSQVIEIFKDTVERLGDDDSDEEKPQKPAGPLLLEQYEAQIHSVIRSSLQDQLQSFLYAKELYKLIEQFLTLGICQDEHVISKTIEQLESIYISSNIKAERTKASGSKEQDVVALSQQYPEKIVANSFVQKLSLINKIAPTFNSDMEESYLKLMRDFLIVSCAQAQDAKNPNCIKDIKSLKILYPSGLGCAINMNCLIHCVLSIIQLRPSSPTKSIQAPSSEFNELSFQCALILLNSQPESLQLSKENDTIEALRIRIEVLKWLSSDHESKSQQAFFSNSKFNMVYQALKINFELGVLQLSHLVVKVYALILKTKERGGIQDLQLQDISEKIKVFKKSLEAMTNPKQLGRMEEISADLGECQMQVLRHLDHENPTQRAMFVDAARSLLEPDLHKMQELVRGEQTSQSQLELNRVFQKSLAFLQNFKVAEESEAGAIFLQILRSNLEEVYKLERNSALDFVIRAFSMLGFYALRLVKSPGINVLDHFSDAFQVGGDRDTFTVTVLRLWIKEQAAAKNASLAEETLSHSLFALSTSKIRNNEITSDAALLAQIEFLTQYYATFDSRRQDNETSAKGPKVHVLSVIFSSLYTIMQNSQTTPETKTTCAQYLVQLVNLDHSAFKELAQSAPVASSVCYLSPQEKTVIQNLMMRVGGVQQAQHQAATKSQTTKPDAGPQFKKIALGFGATKLGPPPGK